MTVKSESDSDLIRRLGVGDEHAANEVFQRFAHRLIALARTRLDQRVRQQVDPEDVVQSVFRSFFTRQADGQFAFNSWDDLWSVLVVIAVRKCGRKAQSLHTARRDVRREVHPDAGDRSTWSVPDREPTPEEVTMLAETVEQLLRGGDEVEREILSLKLQGCTNLEIAETIGRISERKVYRVLAQFRKRLGEICDQDA